MIIENKSYPTVIIETDLIYFQSWKGIFSQEMVRVYFGSQKISQLLLSYKVINKNGLDYMSFVIMVDEAYKANTSVKVYIVQGILTNDRGSIL